MGRLTSTNMSESHKESGMKHPPALWDSLHLPHREISNSHPRELRPVTLAPFLVALSGLRQTRSTTALHAESESRFVVTRIFLTLSMIGTLLGVVVLMLGLNIGDAQLKDPAIQSMVGRHMLVGVLALCFASLVHAIVFTYFMGTGRWIEETSRVYQLTTSYHDESRRLKYRLLIFITFSFVLLLIAGVFGVGADPASRLSVSGFFGLKAGQVHLGVAVSALLLNLLTNVQEFRSIERNGEIIETVLGDVRRIRAERGLPES